MNIEFFIHSIIDTSLWHSFRSALSLITVSGYQSNFADILVSEFLLPSKERPATSAMAARRLVSASLGLTSKVSQEKRQKERQQLKEAKGTVLIILHL